MKGYQISQYDLPLCSNGYLMSMDRRRASTRRTRASSASTSKRTPPASAPHARDGESYSLMDVNRAGVPLMEIVAAPDIASPEEAAALPAKLRTHPALHRRLHGNMEEGAFRVRRQCLGAARGQAEYGTKVEIKNMNSFRAVQRALDFEVERQTQVLESGGRDRAGDARLGRGTGLTVSQRSKEQAHDYRYFPEPDLRR